MVHTLSCKKKGSPPWALTFASVALLLFAILVVLLSASRADPGKSVQLLQSLQRAFGVRVLPFALGVAPEQHADPIEFNQKIALLHQLAPLIDSHDAEVETTADGFVMRIRMDSLFLPDGSSLRPEVKSRLRGIAAVLSGIENLVRVTGYAEGGASQEAAQPKPAPAPVAPAKASSPQQVSLPRAVPAQGEPLLGLAHTLLLHPTSRGALQRPAAARVSDAVQPASVVGEAVQPAPVPAGPPLAASASGLGYAQELARLFTEEGGVAGWRLASRGLSLSALPAREGGMAKGTDRGQARTMEILITREMGAMTVDGKREKSERAETGK
ncbi:MAG: hypothetical protein H7835_11540 [Magnetococcus sp. XQGC-1]